MPASLLNTRDRNRQRRVSRHYYRDIDRTVLLGADQLLAVVNDNVSQRTIGDIQLRNAARVGDFGDLDQPFRQRLVKFEQRRGITPAAEERKYLHFFEDLWRAN